MRITPPSRSALFLKTSPSFLPNIPPQYEITNATADYCSVYEYIRSPDNRKAYPDGKRVNACRNGKQRQLAAFKHFRRGCFNAFAVLFFKAFNQHVCSDCSQQDKSNPVIICAYKPLKSRTENIPGNRHDELECPEIQPHFNCMAAAEITNHPFVTETANASIARLTAIRKTAKYPIKVQLPY